MYILKKIHTIENITRKIINTIKLEFIDKN